MDAFFMRSCSARVGASLGSGLAASEIVSGFFRESVRQAPRRASSTIPCICSRALLMAFSFFNIARIPSGSVILEKDQGAGW